MPHQRHCLFKGVHKKIIFHVSTAHIFIIRAKTHLVVLLVDGGFSSYRNHYHHYGETKGFLTQAADLGLVEIVKPNSSRDVKEDVLDL